MILLLLLLVPVAIGLGGMLASKGRITLREFIVMEAAMLVVIIGGYEFALSSRSDDVEIWNGTIASKTERNVTCCHDYCCAYTTCCSGSGKDRTCSQCCSMYCKEHSHDVQWDATTSFDENVFHDGCNRPGKSPPARWSSIVVGEPASVARVFTNYVKGNPDSILRRQGAQEKWQKLLPAYPHTYDYYRADHLIPVGVGIPELPRLQKKLAEINGRLGSAKKVNVLLVVTGASDPSYAEGLREHWIGGKKNDLVVIVGITQFPKIAWASVMSWSKSEELKISIRDSLAGADWDGDRVLDTVESQVREKFVKRNWHDFDYLESTIEPSQAACITLFIIGIVLAVGLTVYFWREDVL